MEFNIMVLPGDGIGPEVIAEGVKVLETVGRKFGHRFNLTYDDIGGVAIDNYGIPLRPETLDLARRCDAVLLGAVGGPKWDDPGAVVRPEEGLLAIRKGLGVFANIRPVKVFPELVDSSVLKPWVLEGVDILVIRELTGGLYYALPKRRQRTKHGWTGVDTLRYSQQEIEKVLRVGFELARRRKKKLTSVDKANVLETSRLWREVATELAQEYPDVELEHVLVDTCAMQLIQRPSRFDVIVAENTFGDILTDEAAVLAASMGLLPSASLASLPGTTGQSSGGDLRPATTSASRVKKPVEGRRPPGLYEPIHGSAPYIAGQGVANPIATILSVALMMRYSLDLIEDAAAVERAVDRAVGDGYRTPDIFLHETTGQAGRDVGPETASVSRVKKVGTVEMGDKVAEAL